MKSLFQVAEENVKKRGEYDLLFFEGRSYSNALLLDRAEHLARLLLAKGIKPGDHILILLPNGPEIFTAFLALSRLGTVAVPIGSRLTSKEIGAIARDSEALWALSDADLAPKIKETDAFLPDHIFLVKSLLAEKSHRLPLESFEPAENDLACLVYTSGTTGEPKGVMLSAGNIYAEGSGVANAYTVPGEDPSKLTQLLVLPLSHSYGLLVMFMTFFFGNKTVVLPRFSTEPVLRAIQENEVRLMWGVPTMYNLLLSFTNAENYVKSVVQWDAGGAALPATTRKGLEERFGGVVTDGYGCTEASGCVTTQDREHWSPPECQGFPIEGDDIEVIDLEGRIVPDGTPGEFRICGKTVMMGYWKKPQLTERSLKEGKYLSGDLGVKNPQGFFTFLERKDDLIIRGGENLYPREIENQLYLHPAIREAKAIGIPDPIMGQEAIAYVSLWEGSAATPEELKRFLSDRLVSYKLPKLIEILPDLPKNSNGKILGRQLSSAFSPMKETSKKE